MRKRILFIMESLRIGGAEKSLVTLLSTLDSEKYDVDLFLFRHVGEFMSQLPSNVNLLEEDKRAAYFQENFKTAWIKYLAYGDLKRAWCSLCWLVQCFINKYLFHKSEYYGWEYQRNIYSNIESQYDVAIGFLEKKTTYFVVDNVNAVKKYAFMHTDYDAIPHDKRLDQQYFEKLDGLAVVSEHVGDVILKRFPFMRGKMHVIKNMVSLATIKNMACEDAPEMRMCGCETIIISTVGRLTRAKGIDLAIRILKRLLDMGINAEWFVVGEGEERASLEVQMIESGVKGRLHLLGARANPYPYIKKADIYVQPSRWEGYGITVAEAKVLCKPIVASDIPEFREQLEHNVTGKIATTEEEFVKEISLLVSDLEERKRLAEKLRSIEANQEDLMKFYEMIEDDKNGI